MRCRDGSIGHLLGSYAPFPLFLLSLLVGPRPATVFATGDGGFVMGSSASTALPYADAFRVVTTGDSLAAGYSPIRLQAAFDTVVPRVSVFSVASGGCDSRRYTGQLIDPITGTFRDYAESVVALNPDAIVFMLGTNDAGEAQSSPDFLDMYVVNISRVFDRFARAVNTRGQRPLVYVCTIIPVLSSDPSSRAYGANQTIEDTLNPWLREQAAAHQFFVIDMHRLITSEPDWQEFYDADGVHLYANGGAGFRWMAEQVATRVRAGIGDFDLNGVVDGIDFLQFQACFNGPNRPVRGTGCAFADMDGDGDADGTDFLTFQRCFNGPSARPACLVPPVPPPPPIRIVSADADRDGDVDLVDFGRFRSCISGTNDTGLRPGCKSADFDDDADVDLDDFTIFRGCFNGPNRPPACQ